MCKGVILIGYVYRYTDLNDNIIKYVGIVWSDNRTLSQRIREHELYDDWCKNKKWKIEYLYENINTRTDAEYIESHYISLYHTDKYYNIKKSGWGTSNFVPLRDNWQIYDLEKDLEYRKLIRENLELKNENSKLTQEISQLKLSLQNKEDAIYNMILQKRDDKTNEITNQNTNIEDTTLWWIKERSFKSRTVPKRKNSNEISSIRSENLFCSRKHDRYWSIPCKALLYIDGEKKEKICFDSIKECSDFLEIAPHYIKRSMENRISDTYLEWQGSYFLGIYYYKEKNLSTYPILIKFCGITPLTDLGKQNFIKKNK